MTTLIDPAEMHESLVTSLIKSGHLHSPEVTAAFRSVERHRFLPGVDLEAAYAEEAVPTKHDAAGEMISCISSPLDRGHTT